MFQSVPGRMVAMLAVCATAWLAGCGGVEIPAVNQDPVADAGPGGSGAVGDAITLSALGSTDPDGDVLIYQWTQTLGPQVEITGAAQAEATFVAMQAGTYEFAVTVSDGQGGSDADVVRYSITDSTGGPGTLEGTWSGTVTYLVGLRLNNNPPVGTPFDKELTVTFDAQGQPDHLDLSISTNQVLLLSTEALVNVGDTSQQTFTGQNAGGTMTTTNVTATVTSVSRSESAYSIGLDLTVDIVGSGTLTGTHTLEASIQNDGTLDWNGVTDLKINIGAADLTLATTMTGALTRQ